MSTKQGEEKRCEGGTSIKGVCDRPSLPILTTDVEACFPALKWPIFLHCAPLLQHFLSLGLCQKVLLHMAARFPVYCWKSTALTYEAQRQCSRSSKQTRTCSHSERRGCNRAGATVNLSSRLDIRSGGSPSEGCWLLNPTSGRVFRSRCKHSTQEGWLKSRFDFWVSTPPPWQPQY